MVKIKRISYIKITIFLFLFIGIIATANTSGANNIQNTQKSDSYQLIDVIVNSTIYPHIQNSITQYKADLEESGYTIKIVAKDWSSHQELRTYLRNDLVNNLSGTLFVGNLKTAWYEIGSGEDSIFPIDIYYMDLDGDFIDSDFNGIYDKHEGNKELEIWLGRVDASELEGNEVALYKNYFRKVHDYREGELSCENRALVYVDDDWYNSAEKWKNDMMILYQNTTLVKDKKTTKAEDLRKRLTQNYEWMQVHAHSNHTKTRHQFKINHLFENDEVNSTQIRNIEPPSLFYNLFTCRATNYTAKDYLGGWYIFTKNYGISAVGSTKSGAMLYFDDFYKPLSQNKTIGVAFLDWFLKHGESSPYWFYGMTILGDPTLKPKLVNLEVLNIAFYPKRFNEDEEITINATIYNNGNWDVKNFTVAFYYDLKNQKHLIGTDKISVFAKSSATAKVIWNPCYGFHKIYAVVDLDNNITNVSMNMYFANKTIYVNSKPIVEDFSYSKSSVFRNSTITIYANGSDLEDEESKLTCQIQYKTPTGVWMDLDEKFIKDHFEANFKPEIDAELSFYDFRVKFIDTFEKESNWFFDFSAIEVLNNIPKIIDISYSENSVFRAKSVKIFADGEDIETEKKDLICEIQYKSLSDSWKDLEVNFVNNRWKAEFTPAITDEIGFYSFRARFSDSIDKTEWLINSKDLEVLNNFPKIEDFSISSPTVFRKKSVKVWVIGSDIETEKKDLICEIQYKSLSNSWKDLEVNFTNNQWNANFIAGNDFGFYNLRARLIDEEASLCSTKINILVKNNAPLVDAGKNQTVFISDIVHFNAIASDIDGEIVKYEWDFDNNGIYDYTSKKNSTASYKYEYLGTYFAKLRVTDNDGDVSEDVCLINIIDVKSKDEKISLTLKLSKTICDVNEKIIVFGEVKSGGEVISNIKVKITLDSLLEWNTTTNSLGKYNLTIFINEVGEHIINAEILYDMENISKEAKISVKEQNIDAKEGKGILNIIFLSLIVLIIFGVFIFKKYLIK